MLYKEKKASEANEILWVAAHLDWESFKGSIALPVVGKNRFSQQRFTFLSFCLCYCLLTLLFFLSVSYTHLRHTLRCRSSSLHLGCTMVHWSKTSVLTRMPWWFHNGFITWTFDSIVYAISHTVLWKITAMLYWKAIISSSINAAATMCQDAIYHTCVLPLLSTHKAAGWSHRMAFCMCGRT